MKLSATAVSEALSCGLAVALCTRTGVQIGVAFSGNARETPRPDLRAVTVDGGARFEAVTPNGQAFLDLVLEACGLA